MDGETSIAADADETPAKLQLLDLGKVHKSQLASGGGSISLLSLRSLICLSAANDFIAHVYALAGTCLKIGGGNRKRHTGLHPAHRWLRSCSAAGWSGMQTDEAARTERGRRGLVRALRALRAGGSPGADHGLACRLVPNPGCSPPPPPHPPLAQSWWPLALTWGCLRADRGCPQHARGDGGRAEPLLPDPRR